MEQAIRDLVSEIVSQYTGLIYEGDIEPQVQALAAAIRAEMPTGLVIDTTPKPPFIAGDTTT